MVDAEPTHQGKRCEKYLTVSCFVCWIGHKHWTTHEKQHQTLLKSHFLAPCLEVSSFSTSKLLWYHSSSSGSNFLWTPPSLDSKQNGTRISWSYSWTSNISFGLGSVPSLAIRHRHRPFNVFQEFLRSWGRGYSDHGGSGRSDSWAPQVVVRCFSDLEFAIFWGHENRNNWRAETAWATLN